jgi:hypothetical protein
MSIRVTNNCKNKKESYNEICVYCNKCYRFSESIEECEKLREEERQDFIDWVKNEFDDIENIM